MIYGRIIIINTNYYNKIMDINGISYFCNLNGISPRFISMPSEVLDRKVFNYSEKLIIAKGQTLADAGITLEETLEYTPFTKTVDRRTNYYKQNKKNKFNSKTGSVTIEFE
jgi:hypothetical protein